MNIRPTFSRAEDKARPFLFFAIGILIGLCLLGCGVAGYKLHNVSDSTKVLSAVANTGALVGLVYAETDTHYDPSNDAPIQVLKVRHLKKGFEQVDFVIHPEGLRYTLRATVSPLGFVIGNFKILKKEYVPVAPIS